jgi:hypothetical protein
MFPPDKSSLVPELLKTHWTRIHFRQNDFLRLNRYPLFLNLEMIGRICFKMEVIGIDLKYFSAQANDWRIRIQGSCKLGNFNSVLFCVFLIV